MPIPQKLVIPVFLLFLFAGAMVLGPLLYGALQGVFPIPFHRAMNRAIMVSAVIGLILFWSRISLRSLWPWTSQAWKDVALGYFMAFVSAQAMLGLVLFADGFTAEELTSAQIGKKVGAALLAALLVPVAEETIFRGFLQGELTKSFGWRAGWIATAVIFMLSHFIKISSTIDSQPVYWWSGATALGAAFQPILQGEFLSLKGLNLLLLGLLLGGIFLRTGTLWLCAALHSGWILVNLLFTDLTKPAENRTFMSNSGDILSHPVTSLVFIMLGFWLWRYYRNPSIVPENGAESR